MRRSSRRNKALWVAVNAAALAGLSHSTAQANTCTWLSTTSPTWTSAANWSASTVPGANDAAVFAIPSLPPSSTATIPSDVDLGALLYNSTSSTLNLTVNGTGQLSLFGKTASVTEPGGAFVGPNVVLAATSSVSNGAKNLTLASGITLRLMNTQNVILATGGTASAVGNNITINGNITQANGVNAGLTFLGNGSSTIGGGVLTLAGTNSFTGGFVVGSPDGLNGAQVLANNVNSIGTGSIVINDQSQLQFNVTGVYGSPGQLLTLNGTGLGNNVISSGTVRSGGTSAAWVGNVVIGTSLPNNQTNGFVVISATNNKAIEFRGNVTGTGSMQKQGGGTLLFSGTLNTATGATQIGNGNVTVAPGSSISTGDLIMLQSSGNTGVALNLYNAFQTVGNLSSGYTQPNTVEFINLGNTAAGFAGGQLNLKQTGTTTFGYGPTNTNSATITGTGSLSLDAASTGKLTLTGQNIYSGGTTINGGVLNLANGLSGSATGFGTVTVNSGGTLASGQATVFGSPVNFGTASGPVVVNSGGNLSPGGSAAAGSITIGGLFAHTGGSLNFDLVGGTSASADQVTSTGSISFDDLSTVKIFGSKLAFGSYKLINFSGGGSVGSGTGTFIPSVNPGGTGRSYLLTLDNTGLTLDIADTATERFWSTTGANPAADGSGTWANGATSFFNTNPNTTNAPYDNASNNSVIIGNGGSGGTITLNGPVRVGGALIFGSTNNDPGYTITSSGPTLTLAGGIAASINATINAPVVLETSQSFTADATHTVTINGNISESGGPATLTKDDSGTVILNGTGSYSGGTNIAAGTLQVTTSALPAAGGVNNSAVLSFRQASDGTFSGNISGSGSLVINNTSASTAIHLTGSNGYTGATVLQSGALAISSAAGLGTGTVLLSNGTLRADADVTIPGTNKPFSLVPGTNSTIDTNGHTLTLNNILNGVGNFTKAGAGTLLINAIHTTDQLGEVAIAGGTIAIAPPSTVSYGLSASAGGNTFVGDLVMVNGFDLRLFGGTFSGGGKFRVKPSGVQIESQGQATIANDIILNDNPVPLSDYSARFGAKAGTFFTLLGNITGQADVQFTGGAGDVLVGGHNTYTGATEIDPGQGGTVILLADDTLPVGTDVHLTATGTLNLNSHHQTIASLDGGSPTPTVINNPLDTVAPAVLIINGSANTHFDGFLDDGNGSASLGLTLASTNTGSLELRGIFSTYTGGTTINGGTLSISHDANLGDSGTGSVTFGGGNLAVTAGLTMARPITVNPGGGTIDVAAGTILTINGSGTTNWAGGTLATTNNGTVAIARSGATISVTPGSTLSVGSLSAVTVDATQDPFTDSGDASRHVAIVNNGVFSVTAGSAVIARHTGTGSLVVNGGASLKIAAAGSGNSASVVSIDGSSKLDLTNNALAINYNGTSPNGLIRAALITGRAGGSWNGPGINSSTAAADAVSAHLTAIGYAEASLVGITSSFFGQSVDGTTELLRYTYLGDANLDGHVNALDFNAVATNFGSTPGREWYQADFNYDGSTNTLDFDALASNFNLSFGAPSVAVLGTLVPEPALAGLLVAMPLLRRRRRS